MSDRTATEATVASPRPLERVRAAAAEIAPRAGAADRAGRLPAADAAALRRWRVAALAAPADAGGDEVDLATAVRAQLELGAASGSTALVAAMGLQVIGSARERGVWPPGPWRALARAAAEGALVNAAASEPELGSPSRGGLPATRAVRAGGELRLDGRKTWVSGGAHLDHLVVRAALEDDAVWIWVPADAPGLRWEATWGEALALRSSDSDDLVLEDVRVPADHLLEDAATPATGPNVWFPLLMAATYLGVAEGARERAVAYAFERVPTALGRPIATLPKIRRLLGDAETRIAAARALLLETAAAWRGDPAEGAAFLPRVAAAKHVAVEAAIEATDRLMRLAGAAALEPRLGLERAWRDARGGLMHPPAGEAALEAVGAGLLERQGRA